MSSSRSTSSSSKKKASVSASQTRPQEEIRERICCYSTNQDFVHQTCIVAAKSRKVYEIDRIRHNCFYSDRRQRSCELLVYSVCMDDHLDQHVIKRFGDPLRHRFLCHTCIDQDISEISDYFRNK